MMKTFLYSCLGAAWLLLVLLLTPWLMEASKWSDRHAVAFFNRSNDEVTK